MLRPARVVLCGYDTTTDIGRANAQEAKKLFEDILRHKSFNHIQVVIADPAEQSYVELHILEPSWRIEASGDDYLALQGLAHWVAGCITLDAPHIHEAEVVQLAEARERLRPHTH